MGEKGSFLEGENIVNLIFYAIAALIALFLTKILVEASVEERKKLIVAILISFFMTIFKMLIKF